MPAILPVIVLVVIIQTTCVPCTAQRPDIENVQIPFFAVHNHEWSNLDLPEFRSPLGSFPSKSEVLELERPLQFNPFKLESSKVFSSSFHSFSSPFASPALPLSTPNLSPEISPIPSDSPDEFSLHSADGFIQEAVAQLEKKFYLPYLPIPPPFPVNALGSVSSVSNFLEATDSINKALGILMNTDNGYNSYNLNNDKDLSFFIEKVQDGVSRTRAGSNDAVQGFLFCIGHNLRVASIAVFLSSDKDSHSESSKLQKLQVQIAKSAMKKGIFQREYNNTMQTYLDELENKNKRDVHRNSSENSSENISENSSENFSENSSENDNLTKKEKAILTLRLAAAELFALSYMFSGMAGLEAMAIGERTLIKALKDLSKQLQSIKKENSTDLGDLDKYQYQKCIENLGGYPDLIQCKTWRMENPSHNSMTEVWIQLHVSGDMFSRTTTTKMLSPSKTKDTVKTEVYSGNINVEYNLDLDHTEKDSDKIHVTTDCFVQLISDGKILHFQFQHNKNETHEILFEIVKGKRKNTWTYAMPLSNTRTSNNHPESGKKRHLFNTERPFPTPESPQSPLGSKNLNPFTAIPFPFPFPLPTGTSKSKAPQSSMLVADSLIQESIAELEQKFYSKPILLPSPFPQNALGSVSTADSFLEATLLINDALAMLLRLPSKIEDLLHIFVEKVQDAISRTRIGTYKAAFGFLNSAGIWLRSAEFIILLDDNDRNSYKSKLPMEALQSIIKKHLFSKEHQKYFDKLHKVKDNHPVEEENTLTKAEKTAFSLDLSATELFAVGRLFTGVKGFELMAIGERLLINTLKDLSNQLSNTIDSPHTDPEKQKQKQQRDSSHDQQCIEKLGGLPASNLIQCKTWRTSFISSSGSQEKLTEIWMRISRNRFSRITAIQSSHRETLKTEMHTGHISVECRYACNVEESSTEKKNYQSAECSVQISNNTEVLQLLFQHSRNETHEFLIEKVPVSRQPISLVEMLRGKRKKESTWTYTIPSIKRTKPQKKAELSKQETKEELGINGNPLSKIRHALPL